MEEKGEESVRSASVVVRPTKVKIVLLGTGECGKATVYKQIRLKYAAETFTEEFRISYRDIIRENVLTGMKKLCKFSEEFKDSELEVSEGLLPSKDFICDARSLEKEEALHIERLWSDPGIQKCHRMRSAFHYIESTSYFIPRVHFIASRDYIPTVEDVFHARLRTTGISDFKFRVGDVDVQLCLTGGQRNERKKWILCFENVTCVVFVAAISEYDQMLYEDVTVNRVHEALSEFEKTINSKHFRKSEVVLLMNKVDLFREKLKTVPLTVCFPEYAGGPGADAASSFLVDQFRSKLKDKSKRLHTFFSSAVDAESMGNTVSKIVEIAVGVEEDWEVE